MLVMLDESKLRARKTFEAKGCTTEHARSKVRAGLFAKWAQLVAGSGPCQGASPLASLEGWRQRTASRLSFKARKSSRLQR
jgi:hypothetical protein